MAAWSGWAPQQKGLIVDLFAGPGGWSEGIRRWLGLHDVAIAVGTAAGGPDPSCVGGSGARATLYGERDAGRWIDLTRIVAAEDLPAYRGGRRDTIRLSVQDAAVLQSFPADHPWRGSRTKQLEQIGNAVPCLLAEHVFAAAFGIARGSGAISTAA